MKNLFLTLILTLSVLAIFAQNSEQELIDTTSNITIEKLLRQTSTIKKVEFVEIETVKVLSFQIIIITNLKTGEKTKGLYLSNQSGEEFWTGVNKGERHAYLDEYEIDDLIEFLDKCDKKWKHEMPVFQTQYHFETKDNLRITFWTRKATKSWTYQVKFSRYLLNNTETIRKSQSDDLLSALKQVKSELANY
jgi:hypothetical protein